MTRPAVVHRGVTRLTRAAAPFLSLLSVTTVPRTQEWVGFARSCAEVSAYSRNDVGNLAGEVMTRIDSRDHAGWGTAIPASRTVCGVTFASTGGITPQTIDIVFYPESAANSNLPCTALACTSTFATNVPIPFGGTCPMTITGPAVAVPIAFTGDVFLSFKLKAAVAPGWPTEGTGIGVTTAYPGVITDDFPPPFPAPLVNYDLPGPNSFPGAPTLLPTGTYGLRKVGLGAPIYRNSRQHWFDLKAVPWGASVTYPGAGGVGIVWNNQANFPTGASGTSNFLSGQAPLVWASGANGNLLTRNDDLGMGMQMAGLAGLPVVFCVQIANTFGPETPITFPPISAPAMSTGTLCLNLADPAMFVFMQVGGGNDRAELRLSVGPAAWLSGLPLIQQAFAFDPGTGLIHASPCDRMRL